MRDLKTLQADIHNLLGELQAHVASAAPGPSFDASAIPIFPLPPQLEDTRQDAIEALEEMAALLKGPIRYLVFVHSALHAIGRFEVAQKLKLGETTSFEELASRCNLPADSFRRILRVAIANRIFEEPQPGVIRHNAVSAAIANQPLFNPWLRVCYEEMFSPQLKACEPLEKFPGTESTKQTAYSIANNKSGEATFWEILGSDPQRAQRRRGLDIAHVVDNFDWKTTDGQTIVDVGGSHGPVMAALLRKNPNAIAVVEDLPEVVASATVPDDLKDRMSFKAQNFFDEQQPNGADIYFFRSILHDWPESSAVAILKSQVPALKDGARLVICEVCLPPPGATRVIEDQFLRAYDWGMNLTFNGKERDEPA